jgi:hypothetical protein
MATYITENRLKMKKILALKVGGEVFGHKPNSHIKI